MFSTFSTFSTFIHIAHSSPSIHLILYRPSLVASNTPSDVPEPLFTSDFHNRCRRRRCRQILTSGEEILASWSSAPAPAPAPVQPTTLSPLATAGYAWSYWSMVCRHGMQAWNAQWIAHGNEGIAFLSFLGACCHDIAAAMIAWPAPGPISSRRRAERSCLRIALYLSFLHHLIYI